jgi:hypothetical protein
VTRSRLNTLITNRKDTPDLLLLQVAPPNDL